MTIRKQFQMYLISILSFMAGAIFTKTAVGSALVIFVPVGLLILMNWDDREYQKRTQKKTSDGSR